ncbi:response regulator (plasmid) [Mesorhizobium sp. NBSH29]|uniref:response regulator n=1 Tax=Mesorhizobium sp. NBSH29 TaxID=2654249 RepID=UPI00189642E3|nr:response regulator [Mesorhizobium sp. NBSH29]QPC88835.1 response regulator [Mesorhizobium sp. NBSH29]
MSSKINILVVEDEFLIRMDLVDYLSVEGFEVFEAAHADEAIAILEANDQIQVMFTDVDMPGSMDGLKLSAAVRDRWPPVRIVVTSGHRAVALTDLPEGSPFYAKPYDHAAIAASLRDLL